MVTVELVWRIHWDQRFDRNAAPPSGPHFMTPSLHPHIQEWLDQQGIDASFELRQEACKSKRMMRMHGRLDFQNESDAVLFKLTWL
jgi:hypothetical protein